MDYRSIIEAKYNRGNWQSLLHDIFHQRIQFWQTPQPIDIDNSIAKKALYTGKITLQDGHILAVYEVELGENVQIERNRASIRNLLCSSWRSMGCSGAFMFCFKQDEAVLRFSYVSEIFAFKEDGSLQKEVTDTKRYTYFLGEGHRSRTAIEQFEKLKSSSQTLKDITKAFSIEALSDMFFKEYKQNYEDIIQYVTGKRMVKEANKWEEKLVSDPCQDIMSQFKCFEKPEKAVRDYVKKLMGRLVFIQFLQKKGWMGASGEGWSNGDKDFIQNLFTKSINKESFIDDVLEPLFDDINTKRKDDLVSSSNIGCNIKVPFLNGGLFEKDELDKTKFTIPSKYMKHLLDFFASYNFTIDENDPDDAEIGIDPEMLGRIFENLLEDNKDKGAFYTPKEIVQYMCRESLIAYLSKGLKSIDTDSVRSFVQTYEVPEWSDSTKTKILQKLKDVKICDPAIGSGAFPMGLLKELYACRRALEDTKYNTPSEIKKDIIQNNIYGVDIEKGAVDIARLRFWLSLIVDEPTPNALPNMDFKIMQGNSLLEQYAGIDLSGLSGDYEFKRMKKGEVWQQTLIFDEQDDLDNIQSFIKEYYRTDDPERKKSLRDCINNNVRTYISKSKGCTEEINRKLESLPIPNDQFFLWHIYFKEVFDDGGFDIVIGNPPFIQLQNNGGELGKLYVNCKFSSFASTGDIYCLFYEKGSQLLKEGGHLCYISSNKWMRAAYGEKLRGFLAQNTNPCLLIDFASLKIFENATVDTNILMFCNENNRKNTLAVTTDKQSKDCLNNLSDFVQHNGTICDFSSDDSWVILSPIEQSIKRKIESMGKPLKDWDINIYRGVLTGYNEAFIISTEKRDEILNNCADEEERARTEALIRPILRGRDIKRYGYDWAGLWLINTHNGVKGKIPRIVIDDYPAVKSHLDQYWAKISKRADKGDTPYNLRNCAYLDLFYQPHICWKAVGRNLAFALVEAGTFLTAPASFISAGNANEYILAYLRSNVGRYFIYKNSDTTGAGDIMLNIQSLIRFPIPPKRDNIPNDNDIYKSYGFTKEEIIYIESL